MPNPFRENLLHPDWQISSWPRRGPLGARRGTRVEKRFLLAFRLELGRSLFGRSLGWKTLLHHPPLVGLAARKAFNPSLVEDSTRRPFNPHPPLVGIAARKIFNPTRRWQEFRPENLSTPPLVGVATRSIHHPTRRWYKFRSGNLAIPPAASRSLGGKTLQPHTPLVRIATREPFNPCPPLVGASTRKLFNPAAGRSCGPKTLQPPTHWYEWRLENPSNQAAAGRSLDRKTFQPQSPPVGVSKREQVILGSMSPGPKTLQSPTTAARSLGPKTLQPHPLTTVATDKSSIPHVAGGDFGATLQTLPVAGRNCDPKSFQPRTPLEESTRLRLEFAFGAKTHHPHPPLEDVSAGNPCNPTRCRQESRNPVAACRSCV